MLTKQASETEVVREMTRRFFIEWSLACHGNYPLFTGFCGCQFSTRASVFQVAIQPIDRCIFCGKTLELEPVMIYHGEGKWELIARNSEGAFTASTLSIQNLASALSAQAAGNQPPDPPTCMNGSSNGS